MALCVLQKLVHLFARPLMVKFRHFGLELIFYRRFCVEVLILEKNDLNCARVRNLADLKL